MKMVQYLMVLLASLPGGAAHALTWEGAFPEGVEEFRILFVSSEAIHPVASNIVWYDDYVSGLADAVPELAALGTTWKCLGSTAAVSAKDHTDTDPVADGAGTTGWYDTALLGYHPDYDAYVGLYPPVPQTAPVMSQPMNGYRLYHMAGNVQEWVWDKNDVQANDPHRYYYELGPELDPRGADGPAYLTRIYRGGACDIGASAARCSYWGHRPWQAHNENLGFRTVRRRLLLE